jgi:hypothetical protein
MPLLFPPKNGLLISSIHRDTLKILLKKSEKSPQKVAKKWKLRTVLL